MLWNFFEKRTQSASQKNSIVRLSNAWILSNAMLKCFRVTLCQETLMSGNLGIYWEIVLSATESPPKSPKLRDFESGSEVPQFWGFRGQVC
jgi:hypothetical protein